MSGNSNSERDKRPFRHDGGSLPTSLSLSAAKRDRVTYEVALQAAWSGVVPVARRELYGFRLSPETVEDLIQEAAAVVLRKRPPFDGSEDLAPYVRIVVRRLALHWLRDNRREALGPVPDRPTLHAVPELVEGRMRLAGTVHAFNALEPGQQALLSDYISERSVESARDRRASVRERKQVQRLRVAMARVADGFAAALGWVRLRFRSLEPLMLPMLALGMATTGLLDLVGPSPSGAAGPTVHAGGAPELAVPEPPAAPKAATEPVRFGQVPAGVDRTAPPPPSESKTSSPPPASRTSEEVLRLPSPVGDAGVRTTPSTSQDRLVCMGGPVIGTACTPPVSWPTTPTLP